MLLYLNLIQTRQYILEIHYLIQNRLMIENPHFIQRYDKVRKVLRNTE